MGMRQWWNTSEAAWGLLAVGVGLGIVLTYISPQVGIPVGIVIALIGIILIRRAYRSKTKYDEKQGLDSQEIISIKPQEGSLDTVTQQDRDIILSWSLGMLLTHGHMDERGLLADRASGIPLNELMALPCSECGEPRNKRGK